MNKYIGVKLIKAEPELKDGVEGYKVVYPQPDGSEYTSWSPKDVFEEAYREVNGMSFGLAIEALKKGHKVSRTGWNGKGMFLLYIDPYLNNQFNIIEKEDLAGTLLSYIAMKTADNGLVPWLASQSDMLADDWQIIK